MASVSPFPEVCAETSREKSEQAPREASPNGPTGEKVPGTSIVFVFLYHGHVISCQSCSVFGTEVARLSESFTSVVRESVTHIIFVVSSHRAS